MKNYVKPQGSVVVMNLNENIATSQPMVDYRNGFSQYLNPDVKYISGKYFDPAYPNELPVASTGKILEDAAFAMALANDSNNRYANCWGGWH